MHHSPIQPGEQVHPSWCNCSLCGHPLPGSRDARVMRWQARCLIAGALMLAVLIVLNWNGILQSFGLAK